MNRITVKTFDNIIDAYILKNRLETDNIECFIQDENTVSIDPLLSNAVGGIKLKVQEKDYAKAFEIIQELENKPFEDRDGNIIVCPNCGSNQLYKDFNSIQDLKGLISALFSLILSIFPIYLNKVFRCKKCDTEFKK
ncbi:MAG: DUF2007 domain-containing protein [Crocinitomicaceae bacterium]